MKSSGLSRKGFVVFVFFMTVSTLAQSDQRVKLDLPDMGEIVRVLEIPGGVL